MENNYEQKYKKALDNARLMYDAGNNDVKHIVGQLFPELSESEQKPNGGIVREDFTQGDGWYKVNLDYLSKAQVEEIEQLVEKWNPKEVSEDEKIKKAILIYLDWLDGKKDYLPKGDYTIKDMILWLEKQGEQKIEENKGNIGGISPNWSEEEEAVLDALIRRLEGEDIYVSPHLAVECLKSLKGRVHSKQEWSEEDKYMYDILCGTIENTDINENTKYKLISWLKSLQDRVQSQPKQEWSEEDINMIDWLIRCCEEEHKELCNVKYGHQDIVSDLKRDCRKKWDWLESLKNRLAPQNTWKPSKEQIDLLQAIINEPNNAASESCQIVLREVLEQLKKLKEE